MSFLPQLSLLTGLGTGSEYAGWHTFRLCLIVLQGRIQDFGFGGALAGCLSPSGVQGQRPGGGLEAKPPEVRRMLRHEADKNHLRREKNKSIQTDIVYDNIIISSTRRFLFPAIFVLKYKTSTTCGCDATILLCNLSH